MKKLETITPESYEAPVLLDIMPVTINVVSGESNNGEPDDNTTGGGGLGGGGDDEP